MPATRKNGVLGLPSPPCIGTRGVKRGRAGSGTGAPEVGAAPEYKPGIAALYRELEVACVPVATDSGVWWPAKGTIPQGVATFEFLEPIPAGLKRAPFMVELEQRIETASTALLS